MKTIRNWILDRRQTKICKKMRQNCRAILYDMQYGGHEAAQILGQELAQTSVHFQNVVGAAYQDHIEDLHFYNE